MNQNYEPLKGSERLPAQGAVFLGPADADERFSVTIVLRRRTDGPPIPTHEDFAATPPADRPRLSSEEFAAKYGASPEDIKMVIDFATSHGLTVVETHPSRRTVVVSGTTAQMNAAFRVSLGRYQHRTVRRHGEKPQVEVYRGRDGVIHVPTELADAIIGVFGLDNRRVTKHNGADPPNTHPLPVSTITRLYNFPTNSAAGQVIGILSEDGYLASDIQATFAGNPPVVTDVPVDAPNSGNADPETTQDICIAGLAAPGAQIAVYFTTPTPKGWVDLIQRLVHPDPGDPVCSVLSSSFYVADGDDAATLANEGVSQSWINAMTMAFQDAAIQNVTICIASGDTGTNSKVNDGKAHVQYPGSDPWVLSVGGTTIGNVNGSSCDEYVWNDPAPSDPSHWGTTGGGVSDHFGLPPYQSEANVPRSINDNHVGRGVPDVAGNASINSGYSGLIVNGGPFIGNGTSASAPLWAGLIAVINAALGKNVGFANPALYTFGEPVFRSIYGPPGPTDNSNGGVPGYPATSPGWNACTGWGSPNGVEILEAFKLYQFGNARPRMAAAHLGQGPHRLINEADVVANRLKASLRHAPSGLQSQMTSAFLFTGRIWWMFSDTEGSLFTFGVVDDKQSPPVYKAFGVDLNQHPSPNMLKIVFLAYEESAPIQVQTLNDPFYLVGVSLYK